MRRSPDVPFRLLFPLTTSALVFPYKKPSWARFSQTQLQSPLISAIRTIQLVLWLHRRIAGLVTSRFCRLIVRSSSDRNRRGRARRVSGPQSSYVMTIVFLPLYSQKSVPILQFSNLVQRHSHVVPLCPLQACYPTTGVLRSSWVQGKLPLHLIPAYVPATNHRNEWALRK